MTATAVIWHDVECGGYQADLRLWEELAERSGGPVLELGCGTGRVSLHLARRGHRVVALDRERQLVAELAQRSRGLPVEPLCADALDFELEEQMALALAPMQFLQLLRTPESRRRCLRRLAAALRPGGLLAVAIVGRAPEPGGTFPPLPDAREVDGWIYSSLPTLVSWADERLILKRLRQTVSPEGSLTTEEADTVELLWIDPDDLEAEAEAAGFAPAGRRVVPETEAHVGSAVLLLERSG